MHFFSLKHTLSPAHRTAKIQLLALYGLVRAPPPPALHSPLVLTISLLYCNVAAATPTVATRPTVHVQVLVAIPLCVRELIVFDSEEHIVVWFVAGMFVLLAVPLSLHGGASYREWWARQRGLARAVVPVVSWLIVVQTGTAPPCPTLTPQ